MRSICVYTSTRADYGLLRNLVKKIHASSELHLQLLVSGTHLVAEQGMTLEEILTDGFIPDRCIDIELFDDSSKGICHSMGKAISQYGHFFSEFKPALLVLLGDRFETFCCASAAQVCRIPVAHIHGGEVTQGAIDDAFRHGITKIAHLHFPCCEIYRKRIIQMGEFPGNVHDVGALGAENIKSLKRMNKTELEASIDFKLDIPFFLVTFHPVTLEKSSSKSQMTELLAALKVYTEHKIIFTGANADSGGKVINRMLYEFQKKNPERCLVIQSLGYLRYLSLMQICNAVIGNSSSGVLEAPVCRVPTINIGDRQKGRIKTDSIVDCKPQRNSIIKAIEKISDPSFRLKIKHMPIPFEKKGTSESIKKIIQDVDLTNILKKNFFDI